MWVKILRPWRCRVPNHEAVSMRFAEGEIRNVPHAVGELGVQKGAAAPHVSPRKSKVKPDGE